MKPSRQSGNAMLFVLIGIVLFAALAYSFTRTTRSSGTMSLEDARLNANSILSYAEKINNAVQSVMLQNGCLGSQISFENATVAGYTNAAAPGSKKCHIFDSAGGTMLYDPPPAAALDTAAAALSGFPVGGDVGKYLFSAKVCVDNKGSGPHATCASDGLANEDLLLILPWVKADVCSAINTVLSNSAAMLQDDNGSFDETKFTGAFADGFAIGKNGFTTYATGCYQSIGAGNSPGAGYHFYYTLLAR